MAWYKCSICSTEIMNKYYPCHICHSMERTKIPTPVDKPGRRRNRIGF